MKSALRYFTTVRREMWLFLVVCMTVYFGIDETSFESKKLGPFISNIAASGIAGFVFYFIDVHIRSEKELKRSAHIVMTRLRLIVESQADFIGPVLQRMKVGVLILDTFFFRLDDFAEAVKLQYEDSDKWLHDLERINQVIGDQADELLQANLMLPDKVQQDLVFMSSQRQLFVNELACGRLKSPLEGKDHYDALVTNYTSAVRHFLGVYYYPTVQHHKRLIKLSGYPKAPVIDYPLVNLMRRDDVFRLMHAYPKFFALFAILFRRSLGKSWRGHLKT